LLLVPTLRTPLVPAPTASILSFLMTFERCREIFASMYRAIKSPGVLLISQTWPVGNARWGALVDLGGIRPRRVGESTDLFAAL